MTQAKRLTYRGTVRVSDKDTVIAHELGTIPSFVYLTPLTTGAPTGFGLLTSKTATSIILRGSITGVDLEYNLEA